MRDDELRLESLWKYPAIIFGLLFVGYLSYFTVDQTEMANIRRFGTVQHHTPLEPGLHFKIPFVDSADTIQVTLQTLHVPEFDVLTVDNQKVTMEVNFNYTIPKSAVYHIMYEVGSGGNINIRDQIIPVVKDRTARVMAAQNMVTVNVNREVIQKKIEESVTRAVSELFGIEPHSLQIASIKPSVSFMASIDAATRAKNEAIKAENTLRTRQFEAQQAVATAHGEADSRIENARGESESLLLNARAAKEAAELRGKGEAAALKAKIEVAGGMDKLNENIRAEASKNWNGQPPMVLGGDKGGIVSVVPLPQTR